MPRRKRQPVKRPPTPSGTAPWVAAVYDAVQAAAAGNDPVEALAHLNETDANRALAAASPFIQQVGWHSERILAEPSKNRRRTLLSKVPASLKKPVETRVRRLWDASART